MRKKPAKRSLKDEVRLTQQALCDRLYVVDLERRCLQVERDYADLRERLVNLLRPEQIDAAKTCGITPEVYALEWIDLCKDKLRQYAPGHADYIGGLRSI